MRARVRLRRCPQSQCPALHATPPVCCSDWGEQGAAGLEGGHGWVLVCRWGEGKRQLWGAQEGCAHLCHVMSSWASAGATWEPGQVAWDQFGEGGLIWAGGNALASGGWVQVGSGQCHGGEAAACPQHEAGAEGGSGVGGCRAPASPFPCLPPGC